MTSHPAAAFFCDFDGTVCPQDVGYRLFNHFSNGKNDDLIPKWISGELSTRDCLAGEAAMVQASPDEILAFVAQFFVDPGFVRLVDTCRAHDAHICIVSDGLDFYVKDILARSNLVDIPIYSNRGVLTGNSIDVQFPHQNGDCKRCGCCKGERIREFRRSDIGAGQVVFAGDGYTDICGAREADIVFARKELIDYCREHDIDYLSFRDFEDILRQCRENGLLE